MRWIMEELILGTFKFGLEVLASILVLGVEILASILVHVIVWTAAIWTLFCLPTWVIVGELFPEYTKEVLTMCKFIMMPGDPYLIFPFLLKWGSVQIIGTIVESFIIWVLIKLKNFDPKFEPKIPILDPRFIVAKSE